MYVLFDMEYKQDFEKHDGSFEHIPNHMYSVDVSKVKLLVTWALIVNSMVSVRLCFERKTP